MLSPTLSPAFLSTLQYDSFQLHRPSCYARSFLPSHHSSSQMNYDTLQELSCGRISDLVDQMMVHQERGDQVMMSILHQEIKDLTAAMDSDDAADNIFYAKDFRYLD